MSALEAASGAYARGLRLILGLDGQTPEEAAQAAYLPGGPTLAELTDRIRHRRAQQLAA